MKNFKFLTNWLRVNARRTTNEFLYYDNRFSNCSLLNLTITEITCKHRELSLFKLKLNPTGPHMTSRQSRKSRV